MQLQGGRVFEAYLLVNNEQNLEINKPLSVINKNDDNMGLNYPDYSYNK